MTPVPPQSPEWARVNDLFHRALELERAERAAFVDRESAGAADVRAEVMSLLAAHDRAEGFLTTPAVAAGDIVAARRVGQQVGQYRIEKLLGEGGMGVVYLAEDVRLGRPVALKAIGERIATDPAGRDRLRREARAAAALMHSGIATVYALEEIGGELYIASEFVRGGTLREEIARGPLPASRVLDAAVALADALKAAHAAGIVHRDFKPENVIRSTSGSLKILDFGLAQMRDTPPELASLTGDGRTFGTPGYMSPEQIRRQPVDGRSDLFALGIVLHEMLTGLHPFAATDAVGTLARILDAEPALVMTPRTGMSDAVTHAGLVEIIRVLISKEPGARFGSATDLLAALGALRSGQAVTAPTATTKWTPARQWWRFHQVAASIGYMVLLVPIGLAAHTFANGRLAMSMFLTALAAAAGAIAIRMHLWFTAESLPSRWLAQYGRSRHWLRLCDVVFSVMMLVFALSVRSDHHVLATTLVIGSVLTLVSAMLIEPATTHAAFDPAPPSHAN